MGGSCEVLNCRQTGSREPFCEYGGQHERQTDRRDGTGGVESKHLPSLPKVIARQVATYWFLKPNNTTKSLDELLESQCEPIQSCRSHEVQEHDRQVRVRVPYAPQVERREFQQSVMLSKDKLPKLSIPWIDILAVLEQPYHESANSLTHQIAHQSRHHSLRPLGRTFEDAQGVHGHLCSRRSYYPSRGIMLATMYSILVMKWQLLTCCHTSLHVSMLH